MTFSLKIYSSFLKANYNYDKQVSLYVDTEVDQSDMSSVKIALLVEPRTILAAHHDYIIKNYNKFKFILTYDTDILKLPNAVLFEFGCPWIMRNEYNYPDKTFGVSTVVSDKKMSAGHFLRHELWSRQNEITIPRTFFKSFYGAPFGFSNNPVLGVSKYPLFDRQYCIIIENTKSDYYFTEKLLDCLICKTIPIYWGANKISKYFDGIIQVDSATQIIELCNSFKADDYEKSTSVGINFYKSKEFEDYNDRINKKILELI
jgi:hypothetical protein